MPRIAIIGSWDPRWIEDHRRWLDQNGPHQDGWKNRLGAENQRALRDQIRTHGHLNFYAYLSKGKSRDNPDAGTVRYRFKVTDFAYHPDEVQFTHQHGDHHDEKPDRVPRPVRAIFTFSGLEDSPERDLSRFVTRTGKNLSPIGLLSMPCIEDSW